MYLTNLTLLANHLAIRDYSIQEVLDFTLRRVVAPIHCTSILFFQSDNFEKLLLNGMAGVTPENRKRIKDSYSLNDECPAAVAIRTGSLIWVDDSKASVERFPDVKDLSSLLEGKTLIACPILNSQIPSSALVFFVESDAAPDREIEVYLGLINSILALYFSKAPSSEMPSDSSDKKLITENKKNQITERQLVIMNLVIQGCTNADISQTLGYSESTIRQEIMKIFKLYNLHHRSEMASVQRSITK